MSGRLIIALAAIYAAYRLASQWLEQSDESRETDTYTATERADRDPGKDDGGLHYRPDIQLGFRRNGERP